MRLNYSSESESSIKSKTFHKIWNILIIVLCISKASILWSQESQSLGTPEWIGQKASQSHDGYQELSWFMPTNESVEVFRLTENHDGEQRVSYIDSSSLRVFRIKPGKYEFRVQACLKNPEGIEKCGDQSQKFRLAILDSSLPVPSGKLMPEEAPQADEDGGPDQLRPGAWISPNKDGQGFNFYWKSRLSLPEANTNFGNAYDLIGIWYTFEAKDVFDDQEVCNCLVPFAYRPVVAELKLVKLNTNTYSGGIWITRNSVPAQIGSANVTFGTTNTSATINWWGNFKNEQIIAVSEPISLLLGSNPNSTNNVSHYTGQWEHASNDGYFVDNNLGSVTEVINVTFYDSVGDPVWIQGSNSALTPSNVYFCLSYLTSGYSPADNTPPGWSQVWHDSICNSSSTPSVSNTNSRRYFDGFRTQRFWADFTLPGTSYSTGSVSTGSPFSPVVLGKTTNLHGIFTSGESSCQIGTDTPSCDVDLTWYTDGYYPNASAFAYNKTTGVRILVKTSTEPTEVGYLYPLSEAGTYEFELRMGNSTGSTLIAKSGSFTVTEVVGPVAPSDLSVVWTNEESRNYQVQWQHPSPGDADYFELEETLPDTSVVIHSVSPGTVLSKSFSRLNGPYGTYSYRVRACNSGGCSTRTSIVPWTVNEPGSTAEEHPWADNQNGVLYTNLSQPFAMGYHFKSTVDGQITQLGGFFNGTKEIRLYKRGEPALGSLRSVVVTSNNTWSYASITPFFITAGTEYTVAVYLAGGLGSQRNSVSFPDSFGSIELIASTYAYTALDPDAIPSNEISNIMYGQVDIGFVAGGQSIPPEITPIADQQNAEGDYVSIQVEANDSDGTVLSYSDGNTLPPGLSISNSGLISGVIANDASLSSPFIVNITATDDDGLTDEDSFSWTVNALNQAPVIVDPGMQSNAQGDSVSLALAVNDVDGDPLTCSDGGTLPAALGVAVDAGNANCVITGTVTTSPATYSVSVTVNDGNGGSAISEFNWTVIDPGIPSNPETPPAPAAPPNMAPTVASSEAGATRGQFRVDESGSATYAIPILTAPGSGGVAPEIFLSYSSQAGNGPLGVGWKLGGLSAISRCSQSIEQDGPGSIRGVRLDDNDRFCLDGQRLLMATPGSLYGGNGVEYRTEIDDISRIRSFGSAGTGPAYFKVEHRDGSISYFGNSTDSQIEAEGSPTILTWAQSRFEDRSGNYFLYHYEEKQGSNGAIEFVIDRIEYTGNAVAGTAPYAELDFVWITGRADASTTFVAGTAIQQDKLLARIDSRAKANPGDAFSSLRSYFFEYSNDGMGRKVLQSIEECNSSVKQACFSPTSFTWLVSDHGVGSTASTFGIWPSNKVLYGLQVADVTGDGRPDVLYTGKQGKNFRLFVNESTSIGGFSTWNNSYALPKKENGAPPRMFGIDLNADGFQDVVYRKHLGGNAYSWVGRISDGTSLSPETTVSSSNFVLNEDDLTVESKISVLDFDGDGLSDLLFNKTSANGDSHDLQVILNNFEVGGAVGFGSPIVVTSDFSNNSSSSLFPPISDGGAYRLYADKPAYYEIGSQYSENQQEPGNRVFDYNGDGAVDLLIYVWRVYQDCTTGCPIQQSTPDPNAITSQLTESDRIASFWVMMTSTPSNTYDHQVVATGRDCGLSFCVDLHPGLPAAYEVRPVDINADGLVDLAFSSNSNDWYYKLNTGKGLEAQRSFDIGVLAPNQQDAVRFEDMNGDGYADFIFPSVYNDAKSNAKWKIAFNRFGNSFSAPVSTTIPAGRTGGNDNPENDASIFIDFNGDGKTDHLFINFNSQGKPADSFLYSAVNVRNGSSVSAPSNVITRITDGLGASTTMEYKPLTDPEVYSRMRDSVNADWGAGSAVYDLVAPIYVLSRVSSSSPTFSSLSDSNREEYHYVGAKIQTGGRGFLGFGEVISYDPQSGIRTNIRYRQDFPYTGLPADMTRALVTSSKKFDTVSDTSAVNPVDWGLVTSDTTAVSLSGTRISYEISEWDSSVTTGGAVFPYIADSLERSYTLSGAFDRKILTSSNYDTNGNLTEVRVKTFASDSATAFATQRTENTYSDNISNWQLGRLATSRVTHSRVGEASITRGSSFGYDPATGTLIQEVIEPNRNTYKVTKAYRLDQFGNRVETTVSGFGMPARNTYASYDSLGRFIVEVKNDLNQAIQKIHDWDAYGNVLKSENIDGVRTYAAADHMGRPFISYTESGTFIKTVHSTSTSNCPDGTAIKSTITGGGVPSQVKCQDMLGRIIRTATAGFDGRPVFVDQYFDSSGRAERVSEPYYSGTTRHWNLSSYDQLGRLKTLVSAGGDDQIIDYDNDPDIACTSTNVRVRQIINGMGQTLVDVRNALGETIEVYDDSCGNVSFHYDAVGNMTSVTGADNVMVTMSYDLAGRKIAMNDPDKGNWQYSYNPLGEMTRQLDGKFQAIDFDYDTLGRVTNRRELNGVSDLEDISFVTVNRESTDYQNSASALVKGKGQPITIIYRTGESGSILHQRDYNYDNLGRVETVSTTMEGDQFAEQTTYDQFGRLFQQFDASGGDRGLRSHYNDQGYLWKLQEARDGTMGIVYQEVISLDARGNATEVRLGNGVDLFSNYDAQSGHLTNISAFDGVTELQDVEYLFDVLGNLRERHDRSVSANLKETFIYDDLNRLLSVDLSVSGGASNQTLSLAYDESGNIAFKSDVGTYLYNGAQPHAVSRAGGDSYDYDANGNQTSGGGRSITYTVFDKAERITRGNNEALFSYGIGNNRYKREDTNGGVTQKTTLYLGSSERIDEGGSISFKRYLGGVAVATIYPGTNAQSIDYLLKDHIGSIHTVLNESAQITAKMHFNAFGERQEIDWQTPLTAGLYAPLNDITTRGFTGHEQVDDVGIVHMNGRIYDAELGRFLQADPIVQAPKNSQNLNRYSYVLNNPLSYTDPSGYFFKRLVRKWGRVISGAVVGYFTFGAAYAWAATSIANAASAGSIFVQSLATVKTFAAVIAGASAGFVSGGIIAGSVRGAVKGAFAGAITVGVAKGFGDSYNLNRVLFESLGSGVSSRILGGEFEDGLRFGFAVSILNYANYRMRLAEIENSRHDPNNLGRASEGFYGDGENLAGSRRAINPDTGVYAVCRSPAGGCQGNRILELDQGPNFFGTTYDAGSARDSLNNSFAGPHDWLRNHVSRSYIQNPIGPYDIIGNSRYFTGFRKVVDQIANAALIPVAAPFAIGGILTALPPIYISTQQHLFGPDSL